MNGELIVTGPPQLAVIVAALEGEFAVGVRGTGAVERVYLDTFDGRLHAEGRILRFQQGRVELVAGVEETPVLAAVAAPPTGPLLASDLPPGGLRDVVSEVIDVRSLMELARVTVSLQTLAVMDDLEKTVAHLTLSKPAILTVSGRQIPLATRVSLRGLRGYDAELRRARASLKAALSASTATQSLGEEAISTSGRSPAGVSSKVNVPLKASDRADAAAARVLNRLLEVIDANVPGTIADTDSEFLHDYRVAVRRTRSVQRELAGVFPPPELRVMRAEFKWLQQITGEARDLDVYVLGFDAMRDLLPESMRADLNPLRTVLERRRLVARRHMVRQLRSDRAVALRTVWAALLADLPQRPEGDRPLATRGIGAVSAKRIRVVHHTMIRLGEAIDSDTPPEDYHDLRKKGKELRYLLELFGTPLHDPEVVRPMVRTLKALQDVLGHHQDREVQMAMLQALRGDVSATPGGASALMVMGVLIERLETDARAARDQFAEVFSTFASESQQKLVKKTFS